ncbi:CRE-ICL-1 protein [Caenorhabditis remanei]|uniref:Methylosome subunit pICln n=1 Tax=Caenorhabditis remanei TaxID=31234 RepID=E3MRC6_CAERE|nr:CRE-ICL-1 protein [Caenorhabditis remanei]
MVILKEVSQPTEGIKLAAENVQAFYKTDSLGNGTLYITDSAVTWISRADSKGFSVAYPAIVLHAISTDVTVFPSEHVFVMVDQRKSVKRRRRAPILRTIQEADEQRGLELAAAELEDEESDDDEEGPGLEIRFVPDNKDCLPDIYHQILKGQEENPEEDDPMYDDDGEDEEEEEYGEMDQSEDGMPPGQWITADNIDQFQGGDGMQMTEEGLATMKRIFGNREHHDDSME